MIAVGVKHSGPGASRINAGLRKISETRALVGIPEDKNERKAGEKDDGIVNAALLFIFSKGSQARGLRGRTVIEPAIVADGNRQRINGHLKKAMQLELDGKHDEALLEFAKAGMSGANAAKRWFRDPRNGWPPNKRATVLAKLRKLTGKRRRKAIELLNDGQQDEVDTPGIDTGQMRRALTYVVDDAGDAARQDNEDEDNESERAETDAEHTEEAAGDAAGPESGGLAEAAEILIL